MMERDTIIFTNGCFDLLHMGHIHFLQACKELGGHVMVGLNSDSSVRRLKGEGRPFIGENERKQMLLALDCVDEVILFGEDNPLEILEGLEPEIYAKSDEYLNTPLPEFAAVKKYGGQIAIVTPDPKMRGIKTTALVDKIYRSEFNRRMKG